MNVLLYEKPTQSYPASFILIACIFVTAAILALVINIPIMEIMRRYQYNVLVILIVMELFTNLVVDTGVMQFLATKLALSSRGDKRLILILFGAMMFIISAFLNNITAVMVILPVIFVLLKAIDLNKTYVCIFFAVLLAISNTGGASSPIGDFPAIVIMTSGITTFMDYLFRAMPLFIFTTVVLIGFWVFHIKKIGNPESQKLAVDFLSTRHKHIKIDKISLLLLCIILGIMFLAWSFIPQDLVPPEVVAVLGYAVAAVVCTSRGRKIKLSIDFKAVLTIAAFLFLAVVISATGLLENLAAFLQANIQYPRLLLLVIMIITSLISGLFSAGPAAAAMMPIIIDLCNSTFTEQSHWVAIAYAAAICAGSSLFLWSATAGFILSNKVEETNLGYEWGIGSYMKYGVINYLIQMSIAITSIMVII
jgi:Na+/H+ antiporter NhaD/arsenite permease-like protein